MKKIIVANALVAGIIGFILGFGLNLFVIPMPDATLLNGLNNGITGFFSGFMGVLMTLIVLKKSGKLVNN